MLDDSVECLSFCQVCDHMFDNCLGSEVIITIYFVVQQASYTKHHDMVSVKLCPRCDHMPLYIQQITTIGLDALSVASVHTTEVCQPLMHFLWILYPLMCGRLRHETLLK